MAKTYTFVEDENGDEFMVCTGWIIHIFKTKWYIQWQKGKLSIVKKPEGYER